MSKVRNSKKDSKTTIDIPAVSAKEAIRKLKKRTSGAPLVLTTETVNEPAERTVTVMAYDKEEARIRTNEQLDEAEKISGIKLNEKGNMGFLGIGRTPNKYTVKVHKKGLYRITYKDRPIRCPYYKRNELGSHYCAAPRTTRLFADPTKIIGWDLDLCKKKGGKGCFHKRVSRVLYGGQ
jgi:hypothetical protein